MRSFLRQNVPTLCLQAELPGLEWARERDNEGAEDENGEREQGRS